MSISSRRRLHICIIACLCAGGVLGEGSRSGVRKVRGDAPRIFKSEVDLAQVRPGLAQSLPGPTVWEMIVEDIVAYVYDVPVDLLQTSPEITSSQPGPFINVLAIGDIREINGTPVKELFDNYAKIYVSEHGKDPDYSSVLIATPTIS